MACADNPLSFQYGLPHSSYEVSQKSVTGAPKFFGLPPTSPSPSFRLPIYEHQDFGAQISNAGSFGLSTPAPFANTGFQFTTPAPIVEIKGTTPAPNVEISSAGYSTPSPLGVEISSAASLGINPIESSTVAPVADFSSAAPILGGSALGFSTAAPLIGDSSFGFSTPSPIIGGGPVDLNSGFLSSTAAPGLLNSLGLGLAPNSGLNFGINSYSTPAPIGNFGSGSLTSIDSSLFNRDAALNGVQVTTSGGLLSDSFGLSTIAPSVNAYAIHEEEAPEVQKNVYYFSAPDETEPVRPRIRIATPAPRRKNINYIFVKAPAPAPVAPILIKTPPKENDKTIVYVLVKKPQEEQDIEIHTPESTPPTKPEVYFIKYRNQQEAEEAIDKVQSGVGDAEGHVPATDVDGSSSFVSNLERANFNSEPVINYVKSSNLAPISGINSGLFYPTTAAPVLDPGFSLSTLGPSYSKFSTPTPLPQLNSFNLGASYPISSGPVNLGFPEASLPNIVNNLPDASQNFVDAGFSSSTIAPDTLISSTLEPTSFSARTSAPFLLSKHLPNLIRTSSPSPFSLYGAPLLHKKKK